MSEATRCRAKVREAIAAIDDAQTMNTNASRGRRIAHIAKKLEELELAFTEARIQEARDEHDAHPALYS